MLPFHVGNIKNRNVLHYSGEQICFSDEQQFENRKTINCMLSCLGEI